ncbi:MAG: M81 family metallopeptidase [Candidatus Competibacterales bacterium]
MRAGGPRIALLGVILESNRFAPPAREADFQRLYWLEGDEILGAARRRASPIAPEVAAAVGTLDATGPWRPVPLLLAASHPAGPVDGALFRAMVATVDRGMAAGGVDGVYIALHGAMVASDDLDPDGTLVATVRRRVGEGVPIVVTMDLHANVSRVLVDHCDAVVGYLTNPPVDMVERGEEAALILRTALSGGATPQVALVRLPLVAPSVSLLTSGGPYGELIDYAQRRRREAAGAILNASVFGGFAFSDTPKNGLAAVVTGRWAKAPAAALALEIAQRAWKSRGRFDRELTPLDEAVALACRTEGPPLIFSDAGDNPGGGGSGRTTELLAALLAAGAKDVLMGAFYEPALAAEAHRLGVGGRFSAPFARPPATAFDDPLTVEAQVVATGDGQVTGRLGIFAGRRLDLGSTAALDHGGVVAVVISDRAQAADPVIFEMLGLDIAAARSVVVKSRGHFRAGFAPWFAPEQVVEVDTPGLTSPVLSRFAWRDLPRPVYPLDGAATWRPGE